METLLGLLKILVKLFLIFMGGVLLLGGGACALIGMGNLGQGGGGVVQMVVIAIVVALVGFGLIKLAIAMGSAQDESDDR